MNKYRVYFAHPKRHYGTATEAICLDLIQRLFPVSEGMELEIVNPNAAEHDIGCREQGFSYFYGLVDGCQALVAVPFLEDLEMGMGVFKELMRAHETRKPVFLTNAITIKKLFREDIEHIRPLSIAQTRARNLDPEHL